MANTKSAAKRARQASRAALRNRSVLTRLRRLSKRAKAPGASAGDRTAFISALDKAAKRRVIHRNAANRRKANLARAITAK